jgi:mono/diheme cytochrome c family protein
MLKVALLFLIVILLAVCPVAMFGGAKDLYDPQCSSCHAVDGSGATPAGRKLGTIDLRSKQVQSMSDQEIFESIAYGIKHKEYPHGFARRGLTTEQINDLVSYIRKMPARK